MPRYPIKHSPHRDELSAGPAHPQGPGQHRGSLRARSVSVARGRISGWVTDQVR
jgi:hypothetical protein